MYLVEFKKARLVLAKAKETEPEERITVLNERLYDHHENTCLHIVTTWNTDEEVKEFVELFLEITLY